MDEYEGADEGFRGSARREAEQRQRRGDFAGPPRVLSDPTDPQDMDAPTDPMQGAPRRVQRFPLPGYVDPSEMPHWAAPPTGEVPRIVPTRRDGSEAPALSDQPVDEPNDPYAGRRGVSWRDRDADWDDPAYEPARLGGDDTALGALDEERGDPGELFSFDSLDTSAPPARWEAGASEADDWLGSDGGTGGGGQTPGYAAEPVTGQMARVPPGRARDVYARTGQSLDTGAEAIAGDRRHRGQGGDRREPDRRRHRAGAGEPGMGAPVPPGDGSDVRSGGAVRLVTGVGIGVLLLVFLKIGPAAALVLVALLVTMALAELYGVLRRAGYQPATLVGLVATIALMVAAYMKGEAAFAVVIAITTVVVLLWYLLGVERGRPTVNLAATVMGFVWVGVLGSYAALLLSPRLFPNRHGEAFFLGAVIATVAYDVGALVVGGRRGRNRMAPSVSPNKTWEGMVGGVVVCLIVSAALVGRIHPWDTATALGLGVVVCVLAPLGDLCESLVKRDLGIKDMGTILPGHGGVLDRLDALLFVIPATFYLVRILHIGVG